MNSIDIKSIKRNQATAAVIKRLEDAPTNPVTGQPWPPDRAAILEVRRNLPVYKSWDKILHEYHKSPVIVLSSETGSGKSTQVPQMLFYDEFASGGRIACTQTHRLACTELATRVASEMAVPLGTAVDYSIARDRKFKQKTRLVYQTERTLIRALVSDKDLRKYSCIILDEAHERTTNLDTLIALLKHVLTRRKDFKVIIMSATLDAAKFQRYFDNCPVVHIPGRNFGITINHISPGHDKIPFDVNVTAARVIEHIHTQKGPGHILVFAPGERDIAQICQLVRQFESQETLEVFPLHSSLSRRAREGAVQYEPAPGIRKVVVSTNIAETSLTINGVGYVVDTGLEKQMRFNPRLRMSTLLTKPISQASAKQRAGRAGRTQPGVCYRLYNKVSFDKMEPMSEPGIRRDPLEPLVMDLASIGWTRPLSFDWLDAPNPEDLTRAAGNLVDWRFLNPEGGSSTLNGRYAVRMPLPPLWFHVILAGAEESCALDMATIGLLCEARPPIFERRDPFTQCMNLAHTAFADPLSDHIALLKAFSAYEYVLEKHSQDAAIDVEAWCSHHALSKDGLDGVHKQLKDMATFLLNAKIEPGRTLLTDTVRLRRALVKGLCTQSAIHYKGLEYRTIYENTPALVSPFSSLWEAQREWIVWTSFVSTGGNQTLEVVTAAEPEWLVDLPYFNIDRMATTHDGKLTLLQIIESLGKARRASSATNKGTRY